MIWFACKQCGKRHGRADSLAGTLVFCECGHGNRVPWSSTVPEPDIPEVPAVPRPRPAQPEEREQRPERREPEVPERLRRRPRDGRRPNPAFCLNHDEVASEHTCSTCRLRFCSACVVTLQGETLCGPCKNFRVRGLHRPARLSPLAIIALVIALVSGPVTLLLTLMAIGMQASGQGAAGPVVLCVLGLILPLGGLVVGGLALREIETRPNVGGRVLAMTGASTGLIGVVWSLAIAGMLICKRMQG